MDEKLKVVDLCAGTGAFTFLFEKYNSYFDCVFANDMLSESQSIYELNHTSVPFILKDLLTIKTKDIPKHDILCAGFPCQPFSLAGNRRGFDDERTNVFWKLKDILETHRPSMFIFENVKNLVSHDNKNTFRIILKSLTDLGYFVRFKILDTSKVTNIPHHRERIYMVGFQNEELYDKFHLDFEETDEVNSMLFYLEDHVDQKYYYNERFSVFDDIKRSVTEHVSTNAVYQYRRYYTRKNQSFVCPTLTSNMGTGGHNVPLIRDDVGIRKLTPRECFNLQGFPETYKLPNVSDSKLYHLAGNAVTVDVVELIVKQLVSIL